MHDTALRIGSLALEIYARPGSRVLEIGSYDVNGSLRQAAPEGADYIGLDIEEGPGVDKVIEPGKPMPVEDEWFDLVIASSVFEHDKAFWMTFVEMCRKVRPGGYLYLSAPSNGPVHRYPQDIWRFYPDAGRALVQWAQTQGQKIELVESFVAEREADAWNDFVAVFRKAGGRNKPTSRAMHEYVACTNVVLGNSPDYLKPRSEPEDRVLLGQLHGEISGLNGELDKARQDHAAMFEDLQAARTQFASAQTESATEMSRLNELLGAERATLEAKSEEIAGREAALAEANARVTELEAALAARQEELQQAHAALEAAEAKAQSLEQLQFRIADLESTLVQRQEEIAQTLEAMREAHERAEGSERETARLREKLVDADEWVFRLAAERQAAQKEQAASAARADLVERQARAQVAEAEIVADKLNLAERALKAQQKEADTLRAKVDQLEIDLQSALDAAVQEPAIRDDLNAEIATLTAILRENAKRHEQELLPLRAEITEATAELGRRFDETLRLTGLLAEETVKHASVSQHAAWLGEISDVTGRLPRWWGIMPRNWRRARAHRRYKKAGLFDAHAYLAMYPDVAENGIDPLTHFIRHGAFEGRVCPR